MHDTHLSSGYLTKPLFFTLYERTGVHFWPGILRMRKPGGKTGSGERARNLLCAREALAGCRGGEP